MTLDDYLGGLSYSDDKNTVYLSINSVHDTNTKNPLFKVQFNGTWLTLVADSGGAHSLQEQAGLWMLKKFLVPKRLLEFAERSHHTNAVVEQEDCPRGPLVSFSDFSSPAHFEYV